MEKTLQKGLALVNAAEEKLHHFFKQIKYTR
jgi:hypothetical protein